MICIIETQYQQTNGDRYGLLLVMFVLVFSSAPSRDVITMIQTLEIRLLRNILPPVLPLNQCPIAYDVMSNMLNVRIVTIMWSRDYCLSTLTLSISATAKVKPGTTAGHSLKVSTILPLNYL